MDSRLRGNDGGERNLAKQPCVYILASCRHGTLYTGVTSDTSFASINTAKG
jgi:hypothetical protein